MVSDKFTKNTHVFDLENKSLKSTGFYSLVKTPNIKSYVCDNPKINRISKECSVLRYYLSLKDKKI